MARSIKLNNPKYKVTLDTRNFFKNDKFRRTNQLSGLTENLDKPLSLSIFYLIPPWLINKAESFFYLISKHSFLNIFFEKLYSFDMENTYEDCNFKKSFFYKGYWQDHNIFFKHRMIIFPEIIKAFNIKKTRNDFKEIFDLNICKKFIALHVREHDIYSMDDISYFFKALSFFKKKYEKINYKVLVFSDGHKGSQEYINRICKDDTFIKVSKNEDDDFRIMASCDDIILSKSTFALWAAYLIDHQKNSPNIVYPADENFFSHLSKLSVLSNWLRI